MQIHTRHAPLRPLGLLLLTIGLFSPSVLEAQISRLSAHEDHWWVDVDAHQSLHHALDFIGVAERTLLIATPQRLDRDAVIPPTVTLWFENDGALDLGNHALEIEGPLRARRRAIFRTGAGGTVRIGSRAVPAIHPEWWGAMGSAALTSALFAAKESGLPVRLAPGAHALEASVVVPLEAGEQVILLGNNDVTLRSTIPEPADAGGVLHFIGDATTSLDLRGFAVEHSTSLTVKGDVACVRVEGVGRVDFTDLRTTGASEMGVRFVGVGSGSVLRLESSQNIYGGIGLKNSSNIQITDGLFVGNGFFGADGSVNGYGITCGSTAPTNRNIIIRGNIVRDTVRKAIDVHAGHNVIIANNRVDGFHEAGIYAMNTSGSKDTRHVQIVGNNVTGHGLATLAPGKGQGIRIGGYGDAAKFSGGFLVANNLIENTRRAINVENPNSGSTPRRVVITGNVVTDGCEGSDAIVYFANHGLPIRDIVISNNALHAGSTSYGIRVRQGESATLTGNTVRVSHGSVLKGISVPSGVRGLILGNHVGGDASYATYIETNSSNRLRANMGHASMIADTN